MSVFVIIVLFNFSFFASRAGIIVTAPKIAIAMPTLLGAPIFRENEQSLTMVHSLFTDGSTNVIFYIDYGNNNFQYNAETIGHGDFPFSDYYAPAPGVGKYIAVEYLNDGGTFGCSGLPLNECVADPHFINQFSFEVTP